MTVEHCLYGSENVALPHRAQHGLHYDMLFSENKKECNISDYKPYAFPVHEAYCKMTRGNLRLTA